VKVSGNFVDRRSVLDGYLNREIQKDKQKQKPIPQPYPHLAWYNVDWLDLWLKQSGYKEGVLSGFRWWLPVDLTFSDLRDCAIWNGIFKGDSQTLGDLLDSGRLKDWEPCSKERYWYDRIKAGASIPAEWPLILRPALRSEKATLYIEDGSGRALWLAAQPSPERSSAAGLIAFDPDDGSTWLRRNLQGQFVNPNPLYAQMTSRFPELANLALPQ
jgi:hypothetical protein